LTRSPFHPTRAVYGPNAGVQQFSERRQTLRVADVVRSRGALTVISCVVAGGTVGKEGQNAPSAAATTWTASVIGAQSTLRAMRLVALLLAFAHCPVSATQLQAVHVRYRGFDGDSHIGVLVVNRRVAPDVATVFRRLYVARFPIRRITPISAFHGSDDASMAADNTSAFNCRRAVGGSGWSEHAYGTAIDVNPVENPYVLNGRVLPPAGRRYLDRSRIRRGMAVAGGVLVRAFASVGWKWGGRWSGSPDYQHFSLSGR
jgi:hypothetical protein